MSLRDYWMTAVGSTGSPVPLPVGLRTPVRKLARASLFSALIFGGFAAGLGFLRLLIWPPSQAERVQQVAQLFLVAIGLGLLGGALNFAMPAVMWPYQRRKLGEGLEATADAWSRSEFDHHIEDIREQYSKAQGRTKNLHARHLAWLEARRGAMSHT